MKLIATPDPILSQQTKPVSQFDRKLKQIIAEMTEVLNAQTDPPGVGLAAPQVGLSIQLFIIKPNGKSIIQSFVNAKILTKETVKSPIQNKPKKKKKNNHLRLEGCLSIPRIWGEVQRPEKIQLEYQTETGEKKTEWFTGFKAIIIQHEIDHLNGTLFTQRVIQQRNNLYEEKDGELAKIRDLV